MKIGIFTLQGPLEGKTMVILDKYSFVDGRMRVGQVDALLMRGILCNHYGCDLTFEDQSTGQTVPAGEDGSLAIQLTKPGMTEGEKVNAQATASALDNAQRVASSEAEGK